MSPFNSSRFNAGTYSARGSFNVRSLTACSRVRTQFSSYIDGLLNGLEMQAITAHFDYCPACREDFASLRAAQTGLSQLGRATPPANLANRIRAAISSELANAGNRNQLALFRSFAPTKITSLWTDLIAPIVYRAAAGMASTAVLMSACALLLTTLSSPSPLIADDSPAAGYTSPRLLYTSVQPRSVDLTQATSTGGQGAQRTQTSTLLVQAYINSSGHIYDYRILSGPDTPAIRSSINDRLLFSVYQPAIVFGAPTRGTVLISFADVSVHG